jgi:hypothetical protein
LNSRTAGRVRKSPGIQRVFRTTGHVHRKYW